MNEQVLADELEREEHERTLIAQLSAREPGLDLAAAYEVPRLGHERRLAEGERELGFKLGLASRANGKRWASMSRCGDA